MRAKLFFCIAVVTIGCSSHGDGFGDDSGPGDDAGAKNDAGFQGTDGGNKFNDGGDSGGVAVTTVYANTDDTLYSLDPQTNAVTLIGKFAGMSGASGDSTVTDIAVDSSGGVYANTEGVIYKAAVPTSPGTVDLTKIASISLKSAQKFYALAFTPVGSLSSGEVLIGGDGNGELYSIDTTSGTTIDLGNFGPDPSKSGNNFALSGDLVFYLDASSKPMGLATVRSCKSNTATCTTTNDYLVAVDVTALAAAYKSSTPAATLLLGIYGGTKSSSGSGTTYGELYGLGAWEGSVFAFARNSGNNKTPLLLTISTTTGLASVVSSAFSFTNGWSGAGVTTSVTVTVPLPN